MNTNKELSVYELGIIKNSLRESLITIEFRTDLVTEDDDEEMNDQVDAFGLELNVIKDKIEVMILNKLD